MQPAGGGAIFVESGRIIMADGEFLNNESPDFGGAILAKNASVSSIGNVTFEGNQAKYGAAIAVDATKLRLEGTVFSDGGDDGDDGDKEPKHDDGDKKPKNDDGEDGDKKPKTYNLIYIADDRNPKQGGSFVDCSATDPPVSFCFGDVDDLVFEAEIVEGWQVYKNTNCFENAVDESDAFCQEHH